MISGHHQGQGMKGEDFATGDSACEKRKDTAQLCREHSGRTGSDVFYTNCSVKNLPMSPPQAQKNIKKTTLAILYFDVVRTNYFELIMMTLGWDEQ